MFLAISAFMLQGTLISISQAAAATGTMLAPSITLSGDVHVHDQLAGHVHEHGGYNAKGHVHDPSAPDHDGDVGFVSSFWTLFGPSIAVPAFVGLVHPCDFVGSIELPPVESADGIDPGALIRSPSTPSIA
jgi:hypothetical protein